MFFTFIKIWHTISIKKKKEVTYMSEPMKVSLQRSAKGSTVHNSRNFDVEKAKKKEHIDLSRSHLNHYSAIYPELKNDFTAVEKKFYAENFKRWLEIKKERAKKQRHPERKKTAEQLRTGKVTAPEEIVYQIGDFKNAPSPKEFRKWMNEILKYNAQLTKGHCKILDAAIHNDENTPHAHVRQVWLYNELDDNGEPYLRIGKNKAMEAACIPLPNPDAPADRRNNRLVTYTRMMREKAEELAIEMGFDINVERSKRRHLDKEDYIEYSKQQEFLKEMEERARMEKYNEKVFNDDER